MCELLSFQRELAAAIEEPGRGPLAVYRNTVVSGAVEALGANYPVVAALLGEEMFDAVAADYVEACPPRSPIMALFGARFPDWIEERHLASAIPYLSDVARCERLHLESLFAADEEALDLPALQRVGDWDRLWLRLHWAVRFDWTVRPAMTIWLAHQSPVTKEMDVAWHAEGALFTRPELAVQPLLIDRAAHRFLFGIRLGESVGTSAIATANLYPEADIGALFTTLVNAGAFAASSINQGI